MQFQYEDTQFLQNYLAKRVITVFLDYQKRDITETAGSACSLTASQFVDLLLKKRLSDLVQLLACFLTSGDWFM